MSRRRCARGHFIPATASTDDCHCLLTRKRQHRAFVETDLRGQRATIHQLRTMTTLRPAGSYL